MVAPPSFIVLATSVLASLGSTLSHIPSSHVLHEQRRSLPAQWSLHRRADPDLMLPLSIALVQSNIGNLEEHLLNIADPDSPNYGKHWTPAQVRETFRPSRESAHVVYSWLKADGVQPERAELSHDGMFVRVNVSIAEAERLLATEYYVYQDEDGAESVACKHGYHLPEHVSRHVDLVRPTIDFSELSHSGTAMLKRAYAGRRRLKRPAFSQAVGGLHPSMKARAGSPGDLSKCDTKVTLDCLRDLYGFRYVSVAPEKNSIGIVELGDQTYNSDDLDVFFAKYSPGRVGHRPQLVSINGGKVNTSSTDLDFIQESNLDLSLVMGLLNEAQQVLLYQNGNNDLIEDLLSALDKEYFAVGGPGSYWPDYPATCQYVTVVGATQIPPGKPTADAESAPTRFASGGGFSNLFPRPRFQERAVQKYLDEFAPPYGPDVFNRTGRAYPDVAVNGHNIAGINNGKDWVSGGTSASAPIFAAMLTAVNDARIAAGKSPVGWINPMIYSHFFTGVWNDITNGSNPGCGTDGFPAAPGWDPVTGLGTPNFPRMLAAFMALP
ncbi:subtilisin-like protein [Trametes polyzona]|nr:subtilisin-like protein [Trametes polyzona]